jgi:hypothetical protein
VYGQGLETYTFFNLQEMKSHPPLLQFEFGVFGTVIIEMMMRQTAVSVTYYSMQIYRSRFFG